MEAHFDVDELINIEWSYKVGFISTELEKRDLTTVSLPFLQYSDHEAQTLFEAANLRPTARYTDANDMYSIWILERPPFKFTSIMPSLADPTMTVMTATKSSPVPTTSDWEELWRFWDTIILGMIPEKSLHQKPIDLRHKSAFSLQPSLHRASGGRLTDIFRFRSLLPWPHSSLP
jgi:L-histidine Nalpha-methyltransferase / hercynylcysteine S-oxide synthase